ncbi:AAA family ATPase, partial [Campylobacter jejuni]
MNQGRIIVITGAPGTGKTTTASAVAMHCIK